MFFHILHDGHYSKLGAYHGDWNRKHPCPQANWQWYVRWQVLWWDEVWTPWGWPGSQRAAEDLKEAYAPLVGDLVWEWIFLLNKTIWITCPSEWLILCVQVVEKLNGKAYGSVMILVTSGNDGHISNCLLTVLSSGSTIHTIALGSSAAQNLEELSHLTGKHIFKNIYFRAFPF